VEIVTEMFVIVALFTLSILPVVFCVVLSERREGMRDVVLRLVLVARLLVLVRILCG